MILYLAVFIAIIGISFWLALRSIKRERLLPGSEVYTSLELHNPHLSPAFFEELAGKLAARHSAAVISLMILVKDTNLAYYMLTPEWLTKGILTYGTARAAPPFFSLVDLGTVRKIVQLAPKQKGGAIRFADDSRSLGDISSMGEWLGLMVHMRIAPARWRRPNGATNRFEVVALVALGGEDTQKSEMTFERLTSRLERLTAADTPLVALQGQKNDLLRVWRDGTVPLAEHGGLVCTPAELSGLARWGNSTTDGLPRGEIILPKRLS